MRYLSIMFLEIVIITFFSSCSPQPYVYDPFPHPSEVVYWSAIRRLTWEDFSNRAVPSNSPSVSEVFIRTQYDWNKPSGDFPPNFRALSYVEKKISWADKRYVSEKRLFYHQIVFDIYELFMRRMRRDFNNISYFASGAETGNKFSAIVRSNENDLNLTLQNFYQDTKMGTTVSEVNRWSADISTRLKELELFKADAAFAP